VIVSAQDSVSVYLGQEDRTLVTKSYASLPVPVDKLRYLVLDGLPKSADSTEHQGHELLGFIPEGDGCRVLDVFGDEILFVIDIPLDGSAERRNLDPELLRRLAVAVRASPGLGLRRASHE
jgi:hypothetical protein